MGEVLKRRYKVRTQSNKYLQVTLPLECSFEPGQLVTLIHNGWVLIVPAGTPVDEKMIELAIGVPGGK